MHTYGREPPRRVRYSTAKLPSQKALASSAVQFSYVRTYHTVGPRRSTVYISLDPYWFCKEPNLYLVNLQHRLLPEARGHECLQVVLVERALVLQMELHVFLDRLMGQGS